MILHLSTEKNIYLDGFSQHNLNGAKKLIIISTLFMSNMYYSHEETVHIRKQFAMLIDSTQNIMNKKIVNKYIYWFVGLLPIGSSIY